MKLPLNIDWQQILLHAFNFILLGGGLGFLLYKPVKKFMNGREEYYKNMDAEAEKKLADAKADAEKYSKLLADAEKKTEALRAEKLADAEREARARVAAAERESEKILDDARREAVEERDAMMRRADGEIADMVSKAVDKMVGERSGDAFDDFINSAGSKADGQKGDKNDRA